ncbi:Protein of unknown function [Pyronema omphalodes CBS 100304]|uniref:Uncharacterized protein n=1 Tax=Pyronema omphalodes (strain CBS 100304) TaxID=1076935 RepID=U4LHE2_PYROM|nr:Protein of unknown function [Pyronema omphalodes CBS 100304]
MCIFSPGFRNKPSSRFTFSVLIHESMMSRSGYAFRRKFTAKD